MKVPRMIELSAPRLRTGIVLLAAALIAGCNQPPKDDPTKTESAADSELLLQTTKVHSLLLDRQLRLPGEILPYQDVPLYPKIPGFIKWIGVDRGYYVKKGQLLVQLIAPEVDAQKHEAEAKALQVRSDIEAAKRKISAAKANLERAEAKARADEDTYKRIKTASGVPGVVSGNEVEDWRQRAEEDRAEVKTRAEVVKTREAELASTQDAEQAAGQAVKHIAELLQYLTITAPFDGQITERNMHVGSFAYPPHGQEGYPPMLRIKELSLLRVVVPVPEYAVDGVKVGTKIDFTVSAFPDRIFTGEVARIAHSLEVKTRTEPVELNYWNKDRAIDPGMFTEIRWPMKRTYKTLFVPTTSVFMSLETPFVVRITGGKTEWVKVRRGQTMGDEIEVFGAGLQEGDEVVLKASDDIAAGTSVKTESVVTTQEKAE